MPAPVKAKPNRAGKNEVKDTKKKVKKCLTTAQK